MKNLLLALLFLIISIGQGVSKTIELPAELSVNADRIFLNDIVEGLSDKVYVTTSALPGNQKSLTKDYLTRLIKNNLKTEVEISGPDAIIIKRPGQPLDLTEVKTKTYEAILANLKDIQKSDIAIEFQDMRYNKMLPAGEVNYEISFNKNENFKGHIIAYLTITVDGRQFDKTYIRANVRVWDTVLRARQAFRWPAKITAADIYAEKTEVTHIRAALVKDINELEYKIVKKHILPDDILTAENFVNEPVIKRGSQVKLISRIGAVTVSVMGIAKEHGYKNEFVRVENINSNKTVRARVIDSQTVIVE